MADDTTTETHDIPGGTESTTNSEDGTTTETETTVETASGGEEKYE